MHLELGVGSAASRTGVAVTLDNGCPHLLASTAAPQPSSRLSVAFPLPLSPAVGAWPGTGVVLDTLTPRAEAAHRYFPFGRLITRTGCALGSLLIGLAASGVGS
jgi:hypothetical protein